MIEPFVKEDLSLAYVQAVAGRVNVDVAFTKRDMGIDGILRRLKRYRERRCYGPFSIDFQLKATVDWQCDGESVRYDLKADTHNLLVQHNNEYVSNSRGAPLLLILLCMPREPDDWIGLSEDELLLRRCCYWALLTGELTSNTATTRIQIPRSQALTPESLLKLFDDVEAGVLAGRDEAGDA